ncbi:COG4280 domain-containing protein [Acidisoma silvae]|uniref:TMEM165/GDT1 family protein n=1 Tax=Acidisoma silvae TaxID=2802396 RepID=A0A964DZ39_9PROT|nr:TMEM165/GDT1 family protein [Acidisoma silvae]MCB8876060.1 TMEM165/GDT1 family protein [Acidisoma silvae]
MTHLAWTHIGPSILAAFLASTVEFVEALTVILAVGSVRGWRDALAGTAAALLVLLLLVCVLGSALTRVPLNVIQVAVGALLLLFGLRWLRKAVLRAAGVIPLHDESAAFAKQTDAMRRHGLASGWDKIAFAAAFQITMLEGTEVVFIVIAVGAGGTGLLLPASIGALAALILVAVAGIILHRPLATVPENALKFMVGVLLSAFGSFWFGEGIGAAWPGQDWSILLLIAGFLATALLAVPLCRMRAATAARLAR